MVEVASRLYPSTAPAQPLERLCLKHRLIEQGAPGNPYVYASYIMSANGAIAIPTASGKWARPRTLSDSRDLQFLYELLIQADCFITSGSYLRDLHHGELGDILQLAHLDQFPYLHKYREENHSTPFPNVLAISRSLDFPIPPAVADRTRLLVPSDTPNEKIEVYSQQGVQVVLSNEPESVSCASIMQQLQDMGARTAYLLCGPRLSGPLMQDGHVRRLYLSWLHRLHGAHPTLTAGSYLSSEEPLNMQLGELYQMEVQANLPGLWIGYFEL